MSYGSTFARSLRCCGPNCECRYDSRNIGIEYHTWSIVSHFAPSFHQSCALATTGVTTSHLSERDETPATLVPKHETHAAKAFDKSELADSSKFRIFAQHIGQPVIRNSTAEVVDVVHADIGRKPAQDVRQLVMRAAMKCRPVQIPCPAFVPERVLELVLDVEQPDASTSAGQTLSRQRNRDVVCCPRSNR